jgi:YD repeat-containing protein
LLSKITTSSGHYIKFNVSTPSRLDAENSTSKALDEIAMYNSKNEIQKRVKLGYSYFESNIYHRYKRFDGQSPANLNYLNYRLRLETVKEISTLGDTGATHRFEYYGNNNPNTDDIYTLPYRLSSSQDHWGYYNHSNNIVIFPNNPSYRPILSDQGLNFLYRAVSNYWFTFSSNVQSFDGSVYPEVTNGANREPDPEAVKAGTLKKIIYPTGGYTQFEFEPNFVSLTGTQGPGIRIKKMESVDGNGKTIIKEYSYEPAWLASQNYWINPYVSPYHTLLYNNRDTSDPVDYQAIPYMLMAMGVSSNLAMKPYVCLIKIDGSSQIKLGSEMETVYQKVVEKIQGGGRTEYYYSISDNNFGDQYYYPITINGTTIQEPFIIAWLRSYDYSPYYPVDYYKNTTDYLSFPYPEPISYEWRNRLLTNKNVYKEDNTLISEDSISYRIETLYAIPNYKVYNYMPYEYLYTRSYTIGGLVKESQEVNRQYIPGGMVRTVKEYDYTSSLHKQVTESRVWNSLGELIKDKYYYPIDYGNTLSSIANGNILKPVDVRSYNGSKLLAGTQTKYNQKGLPETIYKFDTGVNDIAFNSQNPYTFTPYVWNTCSTGGLWQTYLDLSGIPVVYLWSYKGQYPIAEIKNATYAEAETAVKSVFSVTSIDALSALETPNETKLKDGSLQKALPNAQVTTYTYKPLVGMQTMTAPNGIITTYEYDAFGRLKAARNMDNKILENYQYHYYNQ